MPLALEDFREMATASMNKAAFFWSKVQTFFSQRLDNEDEEKMRKRLSHRTSDRPTTVFIMPSMENSRGRTSSALESLADSLTNPTFLEDDHADDMSSLTEPPFLLSKPLTPILRYRNSPRKLGQVESDAKKPIEINVHNNRDECIDFESDNVEIYQKEVLFDDALLNGEATPNGELASPSHKSSSQVSELSLSGRFRTFCPHLKPRYQMSRNEPMHPSQVQLIWNQEDPKPEISGSSRVLSLEISDSDSVSC